MSAEKGKAAFTQAAFTQAAFTQAAFTQTAFAQTAFAQAAFTQTAFTQAAFTEQAAFTKTDSFCCLLNASTAARLCIQNQMVYWGRGDLGKNSKMLLLTTGLARLDEGV
jgi:hypothetical protein